MLLGKMEYSLVQNGNVRGWFTKLLNTQIKSRKNQKLDLYSFIESFEKDWPEVDFIEFCIKSRKLLWLWMYKFGVCRNKEFWFNSRSFANLSIVPDFQFTTWFFSILYNKLILKVLLQTFFDIWYTKQICLSHLFMI